MTQRTGARPMPPAMKTTSLPFQSSTGNQLPYGPRKPTVSPTFTSRSAAVTLPTALKLHSIKPLRVGALAIQKVLSPAPNTLYSPNCPARKSKESRRASSLSSRRRVRVSGVSSMSAVTRVS
jgi:hypothetical protein